MTTIRSGRNNGSVGTSAHILVVDDNRTNRLKMSMAAQNLGYDTTVAESGQQAIEIMQDTDFDLVLLDIVMPGMDGFEVLNALQASDTLCEIPVIVISAVDEMNSVVRAIELGAEDYLRKDFDPVLLRARIGACLEKKRLRDQTRQQLNVTRTLFGKFVPERIAEQILAGQGHIEPVNRVATIVFTDIEGFSAIVEDIDPQHCADMLNEYFPTVIEEVNKYGGVISQFHGDAMMITFNLPVADSSHADNAVRTALSIHAVTAEKTFAGISLKTRIGICTGEVFAGNIGSGDRLHYTIHGDAVNIAARLEQLNKQHNTSTLLAQSTKECLQKNYQTHFMGELALRGHSSMPAYSVE